MNWNTLAAAIVATAMALGSAAADPIGRYNVKGQNANNGSSYSGQVRVTRTGDTYQVVWDIGGQLAFGTGIGSTNFLVVSFLTGRQVGLALYARKNDGSWEGRWTNLGGRVIETEQWTPAQEPGERSP